MRQMRTVAIVNQKGGSAKTTSTVNLAAALAEMGRRILVLDLDSQANATEWLGGVTGGAALLEALRDETPLADLVVPTSVEGIDLVPAGPPLAAADKVLASELGAEMRLRDAMRGLPRRWDFVLVDCPPALGILSLSSLIACQEALVPVETRTMAISGLVRLLQTIDEVRRRFPPGPGLLGILPCRVDKRTRLSSEVLDTLREKLKADVFETIVRENVRLAEAPSTRQPITRFAGRSPGAEDYRAAAVEVLARKARRKAAA